MLYDVMNSELGSILFSRNDEGLNRVHFVDSAKPIPRDENWPQTSRDPLLQETRKQLEVWNLRKGWPKKTFREISSTLDITEDLAKKRFYDAWKKTHIGPMIKSIFPN